MHMKTTKLAIVVLTWVGLCASAAYLEYRLLLNVGIAFAAFATASGVGVLLGALCVAPKAYEDEDGFHIEPRRRHIGHSRRVPALTAHPAV
jgi:hypothetical protein